MSLIAWRVTFPFVQLSIPLIPVGAEWQPPTDVRYLLYCATPRASSASYDDVVLSRMVIYRKALTSARLIVSVQQHKNHQSSSWDFTALLSL